MLSLTRHNTSIVLEIAWFVSSYLLVVSNENEVLAGFAQRSDGVGFQNLCSLFNHHKTRTYFLQSFTELSRPSCCHANHLERI